MRNAKNSDHLFHQEYFDKLANLEDRLQTTALEAWSQLGAGVVHSFDINPESVSARIQHPFITFHHADIGEP